MFSKGWVRLRIRRKRKRKQSKDTHMGKVDLALCTDKPNNNKLNAHVCPKHLLLFSLKRFLRTF